MKRHIVFYCAYSLITYIFNSILQNKNEEMKVRLHTIYTTTIHLACYKSKLATANMVKIHISLGGWTHMGVFGVLRTALLLSCKLTEVYFNTICSTISGLEEQASHIVFCQFEYSDGYYKCIPHHLNVTRLK